MKRVVSFSGKHFLVNDELSLTDLIDLMLQLTEVYYLYGSENMGAAMYRIAPENRVALAKMEITLVADDQILTDQEYHDRKNAADAQKQAQASLDALLKAAQSTIDPGTTSAE